MTSAIRSFVLRSALLFAGVVTLVLQVLILPALAAYAAREFPEVGYLKIPILATSILQVGGLQGVLLCTWLLDRQARRSLIFAPLSLRLMNVIVWLSGGTLAITVVEFAFFALTGLGPVSVPISFVCMIAFLSAFTALVATIKEVLQLAIRDHNEMTTVI